MLRRGLVDLRDCNLYTKRVLVTSPPQYAGKLGSLLLEMGAHTLCAPTIDIGPLRRPEAIERLDHHIHRLVGEDDGCGDGSEKQRTTYSHVLFSSKNGIRATLARIDLVLPEGVNRLRRRQEEGTIVCYALGADADYATEVWGLHCERPTEASTQGLVREMTRRGEAKGARALVPVPWVGGGLVEPMVVPKFLAALENAGVVSTRVDVYETTARPAATSPAGDLLRRGLVDAVVFSSTAESQGLASACGGKEQLVACIDRFGITLAAHGPYTATGCSEYLGRSVTVVGKEFSSFHGVVKSLEDHYGSKN